MSQDKTKKSQPMKRKRERESAWEKLFEFLSLRMMKKRTEKKSVEESRFQFLFILLVKMFLFFRTTEKTQQASVFTTETLVKVKAPPPVILLLLLLSTRHYYYIGYQEFCDCIAYEEKIQTQKLFNEKKIRIWAKKLNIIGIDCIQRCDKVRSFSNRY